MLTLTHTRLDPAEEEDMDHLSLARPVAVGVLTFLSLELAVICLFFTQTGQKLMPHHPSNSPRSDPIQPSSAQREPNQLPQLQRL